MTEDAKKALDCRLQFRAQFLNTVELADSRTAADNIKQHWATLGKFLPYLKSSSKLGKPVPSSFSVKIQRKLASTVPPRPIVQVGQEVSFDHLERLCRDAAVAVEVLNYYDSHSLMVCSLICAHSQLILNSDICDLVSGSQTSVFCLCTHAIATLHIFRYDYSGNQVYPSYSRR